MLNANAMPVASYGCRVSVDDCLFPCDWACEFFLPYMGVRAGEEQSGEPPNTGC